ncbi:hypothetical protein DMC61_25165 [Amycolatopsis sp. WAC 04169]|nr:hypothetical protein DMC61_25165 [Amycolatopsis sp. WAC 04169]
MLAVIILVLSCSMADHEPLAAPSSDVFLRFRQVVEANYARSRTVGNYAAMLGYSSRTLTRACLAATGRTAKQFIDDRILLEAKRLLADTAEPVGTIGRRLGFEDTSNFSRFFTKRAGRQPLEFRRFRQAEARESEWLAGKPGTAPRSAANALHVSNEKVPRLRPSL